VTQSRADVVRELFDRFAAGGLEEGLELLADDVEIVIPPSMSAEPDTYEGHEGARRYFAGFAGTIQELTYEPLEIEDQDGIVIAWMRFGGRGVSSGIEVVQHAAVVTRVEGGKVVRMESHPDMETAREVAKGW
jgi:ketosteroid isomerase-like protein